MFRAAASKIPAARVMGRATILSRQSNKGSVLSSSSPRLTTTPRRAFHDYGNPIPEADFTPAETILLDCTAWFVAFALIYVPNRGTTTEEEWEDVTENDHHHPVHRKKDHFRSEQKRVSSANEEDKKTSGDHH